MTATVKLQVAERQLNNGLTLLAIQKESVASFATAVSLDVGMLDEVAGQHGLSYMTGSSLEEGTERHDAEALAAAAENLGASLDGGTSGGSVRCPAEAAAKATKLLGDVVMTPTFPSKEVARVRTEVLSEIQEEAEDPRSVAGLRFRREVYGKHPFGRSVRGTAKGVAAFKPADLRRYHRQWFVGQEGYVAAVGPDEPERMLDMLQRVFRGMPDKKVEHIDHKVPQLPDAVREIHLPMPRQQVHVFLGHIGIRRTHEDFYALLVMDHILGTGPGFTARISKSLRDEMGLCYTVDADITSSASFEPGTFTAYIGTSPEHRQKAIDGFLAEMRRIQDEPVTTEELEDVQEYLTGSFVFGLERNMQLARHAIRTRQFELGDDYIERFPDLIRSVTIEDVQRVAQSHLHPDRVVIVSAGAGE